MHCRESELSSSLVWNTAYELIYQWIGQRITPFTWHDAQVNKALNSFLASKTTVDVEIYHFNTLTARLMSALE